MHSKSFWRWLQNVTVSCLLCQQKTQRDNLCAMCHDDLQWLTSVCSRCALPLGFGSVCGACILRPPPWQRMVCGFAYEEPIMTLIHQLKYGRDTTAALALARLLADVVLYIGRVGGNVDLIKLLKSPYR